MNDPRRRPLFLIQFFHRHATSSMKQGGKPIPSRGAWLFLFQREKGGAWKILEQTWTSFGAPPKL